MKFRLLRTSGAVLAMGIGSKLADAPAVFRNAGNQPAQQS
jgi:hypothetical protein